MRKGKGWSLLELLTVIAIIAILVAILFPVFSRAKEAAKKATCLSNMSQLAKAMRLYSLDYNNYLFLGQGTNGGRAGSPPLAQGNYGQGYYLKKIMKNYVPDWGIWYCPSDKYAKKDFTCNVNTFGCWNWVAFTPAVGANYYPVNGFTGLNHELDTDRGIIRLYSELLRLYGTDDIKMEHNELSPRYIGNNNIPPDVIPTDIDGMYRLFRGGWGAYGYWDLNPSNADVFYEDVPFHFTGVGGLFGGAIYGKTCSYRDGHSNFITYEPHGVNNYGEMNEPY
jgi:prepilin-type N-terminal cleavage/methylation domain-containing protein